MIAIDTNVLVRLLVADDADQTAAVRRLLLRAEADAAGPLGVSPRARAEDPKGAGVWVQLA